MVSPICSLFCPYDASAWHHSTVDGARKTKSPPAGSSNCRSESICLYCTPSIVEKSHCMHCPPNAMSYNDLSNRETDKVNNRIEKQHKICEHKMHFELNCRPLFVDSCCLLTHIVELTIKFGHQCQLKTIHFLTFQLDSFFGILYAK